MLAPETTTSLGSAIDKTTCSATASRGFDKFHKFHHKFQDRRYLKKSRPPRLAFSGSKIPQGLEKTFPKSNVGIQVRQDPDLVWYTGGDEFDWLVGAVNTHSEVPGVFRRYRLARPYRHQLAPRWRLRLLGLRPRKCE